MHPWLKLALAGVVVIPIGIYGGTAMKEYQLSRTVDNSFGEDVKFDRATKARIVQLAQERQNVMKARDAINERLIAAERRLEMDKQHTRAV